MISGSFVRFGTRFSGNFLLVRPVGASLRASRAVQNAWTFLSAGLGACGGTCEITSRRAAAGTFVAKLLGFFPARLHRSETRYGRHRHPAPNKRPGKDSSTANGAAIAARSRFQRGGFAYGRTQAAVRPLRAVPL